MIELASAYQALGQQTHAADILDDAAELAEKTGDRDLIIRAKDKLGVALGMTRQPEKAEELLRETLEMARKEGNARQTAAVLNDFAGLLGSEKKFDDARAAFEESGTLARQGGELAKKSDSAATTQPTDVAPPAPTLAVNSTTRPAEAAYGDV